MRQLLVMGILLVFSVAAYGQSLGDAARQNRQKEKASTPVSKKVITNDDIPQSPTSPPGHEADEKTDPTLFSASADPQPPRTAWEWRSMIAAQKDRIETLRTDFQKLNEPLHFVSGAESANAVEYNLSELKRRQDAKNLRKELDEQAMRLAEMQRAARKVGMSAAVYDP
jgi:hypothetical protein